MKLGSIINRLMPMLEDARWAEEALNKDDNQFTRRAYIRNVFSMIEGSIWVLKQIVLHAPVERGKIKRLSAAEYALLSDKTYELKSNGETKELVKHLKLPENVRFTFNVLFKYFNAEIDLGVGTLTWSNFLAAQSIRNRIAHPKNPEAFIISDDEIVICKETCSWFNQCMVLLFETLAATSNTNKEENAQ
jgi:hypothetical protein